MFGRLGPFAGLVGALFVMVVCCQRVVPTRSEAGRGLEDGSEVSDVGGEEG